MNHPAPARARTPSTTRLVVGGLALVVTAFVATVGSPSVSSSAISFDGLLRGGHGSLGPEDGVLDEGASVFDEDVPAVSELDPSLLAALRAAARDAAGDGVTLHVNSGWRSRAYQAQLFREAVSKYGSAAQAARWVATPGTSAHESGDAVDLGPDQATGWLSRHGAEYDLCQVYGDEPWHYELRPGASAHGCPRTYADPTQDPRLQP